MAIDPRRRIWLNTFQFHLPVLQIGLKKVDPEKDLLEKQASLK